MKTDNTFFTNEPDAMLKPFLRGRNVKRWRVEFSEQYLIKLESSENFEHAWSGKPLVEAEKVFAKSLPAIHAWLAQFREGLIKRDDQGKYFWELRSCAYWREFEQPKIILGRFMNKATFAFDQARYFHNDALYMIAGVREYVVGLLNSSVGWWFLQHICTDLQNGYLQAYQQNLFQVPIPISELRIASAIKSLIEQILVSDTNVPPNLSALEAGLNDLVYQVYGLDKKEIAIIEENVRPQEGAKTNIVQKD